MEEWDPVSNNFVFSLQQLLEKKHADEEDFIPTSCEKLLLPRLPGCV
jgi:hypothetical protein